MLNKIEYIDLCGGLNLNPIPLEFSQEVSTTKMLLAMQSKLNTLVDFLNTWYSAILQDIEGDGVLYQTLSAEVQKNFASQFTSINDAITEINNTITTLNSNVKNLMYEKPQIQLSTLPAKKIYNVGENINSIVLNFNVIVGTNPILKAEIYKNKTLIGTLTDVKSGSNTFTDGSIISDSAEYYIKLYDDVNNYDSNVVDYYFIHDYYFGVTSSHSIDFTQLTKTKILKQNLDEEFNCNMEKIVFAYPTLYGNLLSVMYDDINFLSAFNIQSATIEGVDYFVYVSKNYLKDIFDLSFNIEATNVIDIAEENENVDGGVF